MILWCGIKVCGSRSMPGDQDLLEGLPEKRAPEATARGAPRLRRPERQQLGWHVAAIDDLVAADHPVRAVWAFASELDPSGRYEAIRAREGLPGPAFGLLGCAPNWTAIRRPAADVGKRRSSAPHVNGKIAPKPRSTGSSSSKPSARGATRPTKARRPIRKSRALRPLTPRRG